MTVRAPTMTVIAAVVILVLVLAAVALGASVLFTIPALIVTAAVSYTAGRQAA